MRPALCRTGLICASLLFLASPGFATNQVFDHRYPLHSGGKFTLENVNGSVQVDGWEREEVEVQAVKTARWNPADLDRVQIEVESKGGGIAVRTRYPHDEGVEVAVEYRVRVPYHVLLDTVETVNGSVQVRGVEGRGLLRSVNGNVELLDSAGSFSARTTNGNVHLELRQLAGDVPMNVSTVNGSVVLALPANAQANLDVRSMNGDFHSDLPVEVPGSFSSAHAFRGRLGAGGGEVSIRTVNGRIRVVLERPSV